MKSGNFTMVALLATLALAAAGWGSKDDDDLDSGVSKSGGAVAAAGTQGTAVVSGKVTLLGKPPALAKIDMSADPTCSAQHSTAVKDNSVVLNANGTLQNVFVYVKEGAGSYPAPTSAVTLDQRGCMYVPHVLGVQAGQSLEIVNSDTTLHNIHCQTIVNEKFNLGQPNQGMKCSKVFTKPEIMLRLKCDVHGWMKAYVGVVSNPFFNVTGKEGTFKITGLPAGTYTLEAWHEKYGTSDQKVTVKDGEAASVNFSFNVQQALAK